MAAVLRIINDSFLTNDEIATIGNNVASLIDNNRNNRSIINQLAFLCCNVLVSGNSYESQMADKLRYSMLWGNIYGNDVVLKEKINSNKTTAQYAAQFVLQRLAEEKLMSFDLVTVLGNKLNASVFKIDSEFATVYDNMTSFFKHSRNDLARMETRLDKAEQNINLLTWERSLEYQEWDGKEYIDMTDVEKIVCIVRDFFEITKGNWSTSDLLLLKAAMRSVDLYYKDSMKFFAFLQNVAYDERLKSRLLGGKKLKTVDCPEMLLSMSNLKKIERFEGEDHYLVESVSEILDANGVVTTEKDVVEQLTLKYMNKEIHVNMDVEIEYYDLCLEILFNLQQAEAMGLLFVDGDVDVDGPVLPYPVTKFKEDGISQIQDYQVPKETGLQGLNKFLNLEVEKDNCIYESPNSAAARKEADKYYYGKNRSKDFRQAAVLYKESAEKYHNGQSYVMLGIMAEKGQGMPQSFDMARDYYTKAYSEGQIDAMRRIGDLWYLEGKIKNAKYAYNKAMKVKSLKACYALAAICSQPSSIDLNGLTGALEIAASDRKDADAYVLLYDIYAGAVGNNEKKALKYLMDGVSAGSAICSYKLGLLHYKGDGLLPLDYKKAYDCFGFAEKRGFKSRNMLMILGKMFEKGQGVDINKERAAKYYRIVAEQLNDEEAALRLLNIKDEGIGILEKINFNMALELKGLAAMSLAGTGRNGRLNELLEKYGDFESADIILELDNEKKHDNIWPSLVNLFAALS